MQRPGLHTAVIPYTKLKSALVSVAHCRALWIQITNTASGKSDFRAIRPPGPCIATPASELLLRITDQHPAEGHYRQTDSIPNGSSSGDLDSAGTDPIPVGNVVRRYRHRRDRP